jgi:hypothetical protein
MVCRWLERLISQVIPEIKTCACLRENVSGAQNLRLHERRRRTLGLKKHFMQTVLHFSKEHIENHF